MVAELVEPQSQREYCQDVRGTFYMVIYGAYLSGGTEVSNCYAPVGVVKLRLLIKFEDFN